MIQYNNQPHLTTKEFLEKLPTGVLTIQKLLGLINRGRIAAVKIGGTWYIPDTMLSEIIKPNGYIAK